MQQSSFDVRVLASCYPVQELVNVEGLGFRLGSDPRRQLSRQLLLDVPRLRARETLGQRLQRRPGGVLSRPAA